MLSDTILQFQILLALGIPCATMDPVKDAYRLWELKYAILEDPVVEKHCATCDKAVQRIELSDVLQFVKAMSAEERCELRKRVIQPR
jgi:hypothetical protein